MLSNIVSFHPTMYECIGNKNIHSLYYNLFNSIELEFDLIPQDNYNWLLEEQKSDIISIVFKQSIAVSSKIYSLFSNMVIPDHTFYLINIKKGKIEYKDYKMLFIKETGIKYVDFSKTLFEDKESILPKFITLNSYENFVSKNYWCKTVFYTPEVHKFDLFYSHLKGYWLCSDKFKTMLIKNKVNRTHFNDLSEYSGEIIVP